MVKNKGDLALFTTSHIIGQENKRTLFLAIIREITDINLETRRNGSKSGDYRPKSGDREIRFKIWRLPDYPGELTALLPPPPKRNKQTNKTKFKLKQTKKSSSRLSGSSENKAGTGLLKNGLIIKKLCILLHH